MKVYLELDVNEDDLFITNSGIKPIKDIKDEYLTIGKYQFKFVRDFEENDKITNKCEPCWSCRYLHYDTNAQRYFCRNDEIPCNYYWNSETMESVRR